MNNRTTVGAGTNTAGVQRGDIEANNHCRLGFGAALGWMRRGEKLRRAGWNGNNQFVYLVPGSDPSKPDERATHLSGIASGLFQHGDAGTARRMPHFAIHAADGATATWVPSITDCLAEDWVVV